MRNRIFDILKSNKNMIFFFGCSILFRLFIRIIIIEFINPIDIHDPLIGFLYYTSEPYQDYKIYYQNYAHSFLFTDWVPYINIEFTFTDISTISNFLEALYGFVADPINQLVLYPPLFLYIITAPAFISLELVFLPLFVAESLIPFVMYKFLENIFGKEIAKWGFLFVLFSPLNILYTGALFLNTSLVTLFFILSLYFLSIQSYTKSTIFLGISLLIKQTVIFFVLPIILFITIKTINEKHQENDLKSINKKILITNFLKPFIKSVLIIGLIFFVGSLPWIIIAPDKYLLSYTANQTIDFSPEFQEPTFINPMFWYSSLMMINTPYWLIYIFGFLTFTGIGLIGAVLYTSYLIYRSNKRNNLTLRKLFDILLLLSILSHLFLTRGLFKYYFTFHIPLFLIWICFQFEDRLENHSQRKKILIIFIIISIIIIFTPRYLYLLYFWLILIYIVYINRKNKFVLE